jgi:hypothetical protein
MVRIKIEKPFHAWCRMGELEVMENCGFAGPGLSRFLTFPMMIGNSGQGVCRK